MRKFFYQEDNTSNLNMDGDYSLGKKFIIAPSTKKTIFISDITFVLNTTNADVDTFGDIPALTNGVQMHVERNISGVWTAVQTLFEIPIKSNTDFILYADYFQTIISTTGVTTGLVSKLDYSANKIRLQEIRKERLVISLSDDLTGVGTYRASVKFT